MNSFDSKNDESIKLLKSTFKKTERAWIDPWETAIGDTFYHKRLQTLRPTFEVLKHSINDNINSPKALNKIFENNDIDFNPNLNNHNNNNKDHITIDTESHIGNNQGNDDDDNELLDLEKETNDTSNRTKFGTWDGVMARCLLNIFGVIMFLRVGFVVGQSGIIEAVIIIIVSSIVTLLTSFSMSAICTNGTILGGGAYYIISRSLGPAIGGSVGLLFAVGNMFAVSLYLIGFAETIYENIKKETDWSFTGDETNDIRIWSNIALILVLILAISGLKYVVKTQLGLLVFICLAILSFFIGSVYRKNKPGVLGFKGWKNGNFTDNLLSDYDSNYDFWTVLAIFFPAVTGIMAGANISGDLRNPSKDIPLGTFVAIGISTVVYMLMAIVVGAVATRYELLNNTLVMAQICIWDYIIYAGIYAATLSSAIASLVGAPRILQAVAMDNIFPYIQYFAKEDKSGEPIRGYILTFFIAICCNLIGDLNAVAPLISQFFMVTYLLINFACFALELSKSPGWRPSFSLFNKYTSLLGTLMCLIIMFLLNPIYALTASIISGFLYGYVIYKDPEVNWGSASESRKFYNAYQAILRLRKSKKNIKNWKPGILVLVREPIRKPSLMLFGQTLKKAHGPIFYATIHTGDYRTNIRKFHALHHNGYLPNNAPKHSKGFYEVIMSNTFREGVQNLFQLCGMGNLRPNTLVIGFETNWKSDNHNIVDEYVTILRDTLLMGNGVMVCCGFKRINWFLDRYSPPALPSDVYNDMKIGKPQLLEEFMYKHNKEHHNNDNDDNNNNYYSDDNINNNSSNSKQLSNLELSQMMSKGLSNHTTIDVWWMIDDGGLCILIPYVLSLHNFWKQCQLRMLMVVDEHDISSNISTMNVLLKKFRLPYIGPFIVPARQEPYQKTIEEFEYLSNDKISECKRPNVIKKWLILTELLYEYSRFSGLNVVTLPIPDKNYKPKTYMTLLHMLSNQSKLPPTIIMRGNGESTLTFYSE